MNDQLEPSAGDTGIRIFPPIVLLAALIAAFVLDWIWPSRVGLPDSVRLVIGIALIATPFIFFPSVFAAFRRAGAEFDVRRIPEGLVTEGLYRYSRNPGYLIFIAFTAGIALVANNPWIFLTLVPAILVLHVSVVLPEEAVLENRFGEDYLEYKRRVRRWI